MAVAVEPDSALKTFRVVHLIWDDPDVVLSTWVWRHGKWWRKAVLRSGWQDWNLDCTTVSMLYCLSISVPYGDVSSGSLSRSWMSMRKE